MTLQDRHRWDAKYADRSVPEDLAPDAWLTENVANLPPGRALELACGLGHNAVWLAQAGWTVEAVDVSPVGLKLARELEERQHRPVQERGLAPPFPNSVWWNTADRRCLSPFLNRVHWIAADLDEFVPAAEAYDLVLVFRFLDRRHLPQIVQRALRPGGRLIYETFTAGQFDRPDNHLRNPAFTLSAGELPALFPALSVVRCREVELADRTVAQLVAGKEGVRKP